MPNPKWNATHGTYLTGQAAIDGADAVAAQMENKWGADRLRLLVEFHLREKFDKQRYLFNTAIQHGDLEAVVREAGRMVTAWKALDKAADATGALKLDPLVWEVALANGTVVAIVRDDGDARGVRSTGRRVRVYTLEEVARVLDAFPEIARVKDEWPGATVTAVRRNIPDPLDAIRDGGSLDDPLNDLYPSLS